MRERNGVRLGQRVVDLDGSSLGRVVALYAEGFATRRGLPILWRHGFVVLYDEVRGVRDGALVVARSSQDLQDAAAGDLPRSWLPPDSADRSDHP
jgi:predicted alpha/beta hydrolase